MICRIEIGFVEIGAADAPLEIVGHDDLSHADEFKGATMRTHPVGQTLGPRCFGLRVATRAAYGDKDLCSSGLAIDLVLHRYRLACVINYNGWPTCSEISSREVLDWVADVL